jgi:hypothetical protein
MRKQFELQDYEPVIPSPRQKRAGLTHAYESAPQILALEPPRLVTEPPVLRPPSIAVSTPPPSCDVSPPAAPGTQSEILKRGHSLTYFGVFAFTFLVYFRPYELFPSLAWLSRSALVVAVLTLAVFIPTQLGLENKISANLREVKLAFALLVIGLLSFPLALEPSLAFQSLLDFFKVIVIFIVMVNVLRTEQRLRRLLQLVLLASCVMSIAALSDYAQGNLALQGRRIAGLIGGLFSNPNDLALHLVTMIPISIALFLGSRGLLNKSLYLIGSLVLATGILATFSRGGFIGFVCVIAFLAWKIARRNRVIFGVIALTSIMIAVALAPSAYRGRLATTSDDSAIARTDDLKRSILIAARHPLLGVGMSNYILYSNTNHATHNAYTQVAAEMGLAALLVYVWFLVSPFNRLRRIEEATRTNKRKPPVYYLAIGLQASLLGYMVVSFFASVAYLWYAYYLVAYAVCLRRIHANLADNPELLNSNKKTAQTSSADHAASVGPDKSVVAGGY